MGRTALIVVDVLNPYDHDDAEPLTRAMEKVIEPMAGLVRTAREQEAPIVYVNDNYEDWRVWRDELVRRALEGRRPDLVEPLRPPEGAAFVPKARHSVFFQTPLEYVLGQEDVDHVVFCGQVTEQCILYSALDAYVRHLQITVPRDAVAGIDPELADAALRMMQSNMNAATPLVAEVSFGG